MTTKYRCCFKQTTKLFHLVILSHKPCQEKVLFLSGGDIQTSRHSDVGRNTVKQPTSWKSVKFVKSLITHNHYHEF